MTTPTPEKSVEEIVEEFYKEFSYIQAVKNEKSGNAYKKIADWLTQTLQAERQKQGDAIAATEIRVREEEANEYNKIIEEAVEKERERIGKVINKLRPILWSDSPETHTCNIRLTNNLNTIEKALTPTNDKHYEKSS